MELLNWGLIKHPLNWVIVLLMVVIASMAFHLIIGDAPKPAAE